LITAPEMRAGKTRLLEVLELVVHEPEATVDTSGPSLFRAIEEQQITLLIDEIDEFFRRRSEDTAAVRQVINSGYRRGKFVHRTEFDKAEKKFKVVKFSTFSAKAMAGIDRGGELPETLIDRAIPIRLRRKRGDKEVDRLIVPRVEPEVEPLRLRLSMLQTDEQLMQQLADAEPELPDVHDRAQEIWWHLLAIADAAEGEWPHRAREAAVALTGEQSEYGTRGSVGVELLRDIKTVFNSQNAQRRIGDHRVDKIFSQELVEDLIKDRATRWDATTMTQHKLASMLKPYGISPGTRRIGDDTKKGYERSQFVDAWESWLSDPEGVSGG
jgi:hypothetical protein